ncbi:hypothetical protein [Phenylobacterium montanum]|uniref:Uncharacterized protein n=1 Tax=Phenylobacterium montanum TaxID=2823693 RepID=A0A975ISZ3_9CAUL|nr:hypothetical protein [Caulobacter sp. S6]QUD86238.1 hypothetical protein KCG34_14140 [Caulobacter sp. S6]
MIDGLVAEVDAQATRQRARKADDQRRLAETLAAMVLDLFVAAESPRSPWLAYSRRREDYSTALTRYMRPEVTYTAAVEVADFLAANGYAEAKLGSYSRFSAEDWTGGRGYRSRLRATEKLVDRFRRDGVTRADIEDSDTTELIRLKGAPEGNRGRKPLIPYEDTSETRRMRDGLRAWAKLVNQFEIKAADFDPMAPAEDDDLDNEEAGEYVDPTEAALYRVFNDGEWSRGGRFYGGWWQSMPKLARATITIDGEATVELDFKSFHPRMLYHLCSRPLDPDNDPYRLGGLWRDVDRDVVKVAFNQLLAINGDGRPKKPAKAKLPPGVSYKSLVEGLETRHLAIAGWLRQGLAVRLQNIDSMIAEAVLERFTRSLRRPVLPVHDSFIVASRDEFDLGYAMSVAYRAVLTKLTGIDAYPVIAGWTSPEVERAVQAALADDDDL